MESPAPLTATGGLRVTTQPLGGVPAPTIEWVNHASFITEIGRLSLICDPWLEGTAFKDGWELLAPTAFKYEDFERITHLWISHQHPDHFAPTNLRKIPARARARIRVFYKLESDKLVVSWLRTNGFTNVTELVPDVWTEIEPGISFMCGRNDDDSWLAIRSSWGTILNVNDCVLKRARDIERIARLVGPVDVLFTQFSYAQWTGNPEDRELRKLEALEKLDRIRLQDRILSPKTIVPFASFVYFCNRENFFLNDGMNAVGEVARFIEVELGKRAVVLYPGDRWTTSRESDWRPAAQRYAAETSVRLGKGPTRAAAPIPAKDLENQVNGFIARLRAKNPAVKTFLRKKATLFVTDSQRGYSLSIGGIRSAPLLRPDTADIVTASENVLYAFRTPWGGNTLHVSGRFISRIPGGHLRFFHLLRQLHHYNRTPIDRGWLGQQCRRIARGFLRRIKDARARAA